jgi:hypothetical protein
MDHIENIPLSIVVVQLLQLPSSRLHNTVFNDNSIVVEACLPRYYIAPFVSRSLLSGWSICHDTLEVHDFYSFVAKCTSCFSLLCICILVLSSRKLHHVVWFTVLP